MSHEQQHGTAKMGDDALNPNALSPFFIAALLFLRPLTNAIPCLVEDALTS
jgi:hypothetical protein